MPEIPKTRHRFALLDELRGVAIVAMVIYHAAYDLIYTYQISIPIFFSPLVEDFLHPLFAGLFLFMSGLSCSLSHNNLKRGLKLAAVSATLTLVTALFDSAILFGVLHLLTACILLYCLCGPMINKMAEKAACAAGAALLIVFVLLRVILLELATIRASGVLEFAILIIGLPGEGFSSADYFPLLPWTAAFFSGSCFAKTILRWLKQQKGGILTPFATIGRHSLLVYLIHQPLLLGLFGIILRK